MQHLLFNSFSSYTLNTLSFVGWYLYDVVQQGGRHGIVDSGDVLMLELI